VTSLRRRWLDLPVRTKGLCVVAVPLVALLALSGTTLALTVQERHQRADAIRVNAVVAAAQAVLTDALEGETGVRGYAVTRETMFLQPYEAAVLRLPAHLADLSAGAAAVGDLSGPAKTVATTAAERFAMLAAVRASVRAGAADGELIRQLEAGKIVMDRLRAQVADFVGGPAREVADRVAAINRAESRLQWSTSLGLVLGLLAGLIGVALFGSGIANRLRVAADNADRLGGGRPLTPMAPAGDELGRLAESLSRAEGVLTSRHAELGAARDAALRATTAKNSFLSRTSHELRTPLNAILGFGQLLEMSELPERDRDGVARILSAGRHLLLLINELIDISRIESGDLNLSVEPVAVQALVTGVTDLIRPLAATRDIDVRLDDCPDGLAVQADHQRLNQILINLTSNAVKYNVRGGSIAVSCRPTAEGRVEIAVADTGPGISDDDLAQVFVPFERLGAERQDIEGTGIGLPLSRSLAEAMGGTLTVRSSPGRGSTFTVVLTRAPDVTGAPVVEDGPGPAGHGGASGPVVVLSIEDNPANSEVIARYLGGRPGTTLHAAASGTTGLELARTHKPSVILLDLHLPGLSGEEVLERLRTDPLTADIPVIVLSADATPGTIRRLRARGISDYLTKPVDLAALGRAIDATVRERQTVLYIDDEPNNIILVEALLGDRVRLIGAGSGRDGLDQARAELPRLILLDRRLPDMTGNDVLRRLKESAATGAIPVVVLSGDSGREHAEELTELGAAGFLAKPFDIGDLLRIVDRYC
jgi:signal transduction histidine kinase/CheY-like chemotaxis protein